MTKTLIGRENEYSNLKTKIEKSIKSGVPLSLYVSGAPGTGKTATVKALSQSISDSKKVKYIYINCVGINKKTDVEKAILSNLVDTLPSTVSLYGTELHNQFTNARSKKKIILVLDEIDHLCKRRNDFLCSAFRWPTDSKGKVIVIGIANSLDLTTRLLPNLKSSGGLEPEVYSFQPYKTEQIVEILKEHLSSQSVGNEKTILYCAKKVAAQTGDIRVALNIVDKAFQEMEDEEEENEGFLPQQQPRGLSTPKKNSMHAVNRIFKDVQASPLIRSILPEHSRILLATLIRLVGNTKTKSTTKVKLLDSYMKVCKNLKITAVTGDDRIQALSNLETMSVISFSGKGPQEKVTFIDEIEQARAKIADSNLVATVDDMDL